MGDPFESNRDAAEAFGENTENAFRSAGKAFDALKGTQKPRQNKKRPSSDGGTTINIYND